MKSQIVMTMMTVLLAPAAMSAQRTDAQSTAQASSEAQAPQARIAAALSAAAKANIPAELVRSKIAEGEAKRVPQERIAAAVEARVTALVRAADVMRRADVEPESAGELAVAADAIAAGVSDKALVQISRDASDERRTVAVAVLADLVRLGNDSDRAMARVHAALTSNTSLANLHAEVASQLRLGGLSPTLDATGLLKIR